MDKKNSQNNSTDENKKTKGETDSLKKEVEAYRNKYLRALADYQNLEKRVSEEKESYKKNVIGQMILKMLPVLDSLEKAEVFIKDEGLAIVKNNLWQILSGLGVEEIAVLNREFDPFSAEAVEIVAGDKDNMVVEVIKKRLSVRRSSVKAGSSKGRQKNHKAKLIISLFFYIYEQNYWYRSGNNQLLCGRYGRRQAKSYPFPRRKERHSFGG
jgi:molecular chaperone GrpE